MHLRLLLWIGFVAMFLSACGGGGGGGNGVAGGGSTATISAQPNSVTIYETQSANFSISATSAAALSYQWKKNGVNIAGANAATYTTPAATLADNGAVFSVTVTDSAGGAIESASATLTVQTATPSITTQPTAQSATSGQSVTWTVSATGMPTLNFQWRKNGVAISGATASSYTSLVTLADNNSQYSVVVSNGIGSVTSNSVNLSVQAATLGHLVISEIGVCYYYNVDCWFEIYNPSAAAIDLSAYSVKSTSINASSGGSVVTTTFTLPSVSVPSDGYVVVTGNNSNAAQRGSQVVRLRSGSMVPFWTSSGFIELLNAGGTVDFFRFGTSTQTPVTSTEWTGAAVAALPNSLTDYGKSVVRLYPLSASVDTNSASDWTAVSWSTPGGRNDVPANAVDADGDGIPDSAEVPSGTFAGLDLYAMGARTGQRDIFIEVDQMASSDPGVIPRSESLQLVVDAFAAQSIAVHFDAGHAFSSSFSTSSFNLGQGSNVVPYEQCVTMNQTTCASNTSSRRSVYDWKDDNMDVRRRAVFHYALFGNSQLANGTAGSSGLAELPGNDLIVTMGNWGFTTTAGSALNRLINMQASTVMHELGHNLGLQHGGNESTNYKPNYWSVMNYMYQLNGLAADPTASTAYQRWRKEKGDGTPTLCSLVNSPCGTSSQFTMGYSNGSSSALNESSLLESANIGRGTSGGSYADWNMDGSLAGMALSNDLNGDSSFSTLNDYNDWANLVLPFVRYSSANTGTSFNVTPSPVMSNPITDDRQPVADETAPPASFFREIRRAQ